MVTRSLLVMHRRHVPRLLTFSPCHPVWHLFTMRIQAYALGGSPAYLRCPKRRIKTANTPSFPATQTQDQIQNARKSAEMTGKNNIFLPTPRGAGFHHRWEGPGARAKLAQNETERDENQEILLHPYSWMAHAWPFERQADVEDCRQTMSGSEALQLVHRSFQISL